MVEHGRTSFLQTVAIAGLEGLYGSSYGKPVDDTGEVHGIVFATYFWSIWEEGCLTTGGGEETGVWLSNRLIGDGVLGSTTSRSEKSGMLFSRSAAISSTVLP